MKESKYNSRKLVSAAVLFVTATVFMSLGDATFEEWSDFMIWIFGIYAGGNVGEYYTRKDKSE